MYTVRYLIGLFMGAGLCQQACSQTFNLRHDLFEAGLTQWAKGVIIKPDSTALVVFNGGYVHEGLYYSSGVSGLLVSQLGELSTGTLLHIPERANYPGFANSISPTLDGGYFIGGSTYAEGDTQRVALFWMGADGSVSDHVELELPGDGWIGRHGIQSPDGGFIVCGETGSAGAGDAFVVKTDLAGEVEWYETYGGPLFDGFLAIDNNPNGGYYCGGQYRTASNNKDLWVQAVNDTGGVRWSRVWGSPYHEPNAHLITAADGNPLIASAWGTGTGDMMVKFITKLDSADGSTLWERQYGPSCQACTFFAVKEVVPFGDLIAVGQTFSPTSFYGSLLRTTSTGDSLWMRDYQYHDSLVSNVRGLLRDVAPTPDGGFIAVGMTMGVSGIYTQDVWIIKVDEHGCLEPGCHVITGMETQITNLGGALRVWPNPVARGTPVQVELQLPEGFVVQGQLRLTVTDAAGRLVNEQQLPGPAGQRTTDNRQPAIPAGQLTTDNWQPGLYHLHLSDATRWIAGAKLIVE